MSLRHLLFVNDAVQHKGDEPSPFRVTRERVLPQFAPVPRTPPPSQPALARVERVQPSENPFCRTAAPALPETPLPAETAADDDGILEPTARWSVLSASPNRRRSAARVESSLSGVTVVRNDLSETDFEIVPPSPVSALSRQGEASLSASPVSSVRSIWNRLTARLFTLGTGWFKA